MPGAKRKPTGAGAAAAASKRGRATAGEMAQTQPREEVEMLSDEDMEGGFEDVEEENEDGADSGGDEVEASDEEPDGGDVPAQVPPTVRAHAAPYATPSNEEIQGLKLSLIHI